MGVERARDYTIMHVLYACTLHLLPCCPPFLVLKQGKVLKVRQLHQALGLSRLKPIEDDNAVMLFSTLHCYFLESCHSASM